MNTQEILKLSSYDLFKSLVGKANDYEVACLMLKHTLFIDPKKVLAKPVMFADAVRESNEHHQGCRRGSLGSWKGREVTVYDNSQARRAFGMYTGLKMGGKGRTVPKGLDVTHIWGRVYDPCFFTGGWNICLMPNFLRNLTEDQIGLDYFQKLLKQVSWDFYIKNNPSFFSSLNLDNPSFDIEGILKAQRLLWI